MSEFKPAMDVSAPWGVHLDQVAALLGVPGNWPATALRAVTTDSRAVFPGDLFFALGGERVDGHDFVGRALQAGAAAAVVERVPAGVPPESVLLVESAVAALATLAAWWRRECNPAVIAVTGSNGKTTLKEMIACILAADARSRGEDADQHVLFTQGNFNNHLGLPLTLLRLRKGHRRAVLELGMNHAGELTALSALAQPQVAVVNNVQRAHVGLLGGLEAVARAKGEIFSGLAADGVAVVNADDPYAGLLTGLAGNHEVRCFSLTSSAVQVGPVISAQADADGSGQSIQVRVGGWICGFHLPLPGRHNIANALAALTAVLPLDVSPHLACRALEEFAGVPGRLRRIPLANGALLIDDTYNANPDSVLAAIAVLAAMPGRRILVLGDLGELGDQAPAMLAELGSAARVAGLDGFYGLGTLVRAASEQFGPSARVSLDPAEVCAWISPLLESGTTVLVKGSRFMRMERIVEGLSS